MNIPTVAKWHDGTGWRVAVIVKKGYKHLTIVPMDASGLRVKRVPVKGSRKALKSLDYPLGKAKQRFTQFGKAYGWTEGAKQALGQL
jgi:hypothetical protein